MLRYLLTSLAMLVPCFWLPRIEAGDLSSHAYNAWLAELIARGQAPGLHIESQWTNRLFDLLLSALWGLGPNAAQRIAVSIAVLLFFWGAFAFVRKTARREPWELVPILAMLSYGWVFHSGFFNFYMSLGLVFWAMAVAWPGLTRAARPGFSRITAALALLTLASTAHPLPVVWMGAVMIYLTSARALRPRHRPWLALAVVTGLVTLRRLLDLNFETLWYQQQIGSVTGADQLAIYGVKFLLLRLGLIVVWGVLLVAVLRRHGWRRLILTLPLHAAFLTAALVVILPSRILLPQYSHAFVYIAERLSLGVAVCACAIAATARLRPVALGAVIALSAIFFACLYTDQRAVNQIEARLEHVLAGLPPGARVVTSISEPYYRVDPVLHLIDRACIGRCFSYGNYEAATHQFRIRAEPGNGLLVTRYADVYGLQTGTYRIKASDLPLWGVFPAGSASHDGSVVEHAPGPAGVPPLVSSRKFVLRPLEASEVLHMARLMEN